MLKIQCVKVVAVTVSFAINLIHFGLSVGISMKCQISLGLQVTISLSINPLIIWTIKCHKGVKNVLFLSLQQSETHIY